MRRGRRGGNAAGQEAAMTDGVVLYTTWPDSETATLAACAAVEARAGDATPGARPL